MDERHRVSKYTEKQEIHPAWLYFTINSDKFKLGAIPASTDFTVDSAAMAVFERARTKNALIRPPLEIRSPKGVHSTLFSIVDRDVASGHAFERLGDIRSGTYVYPLEDSELLYPVVGNMLPTPFMPPTLVDIIDGIHDIFPGTDINMVDVRLVLELKDCQNTAESLGSGEHVEDVQPCFFMAVAPPKTEVIFEVPACGVQWRLAYGTMLAWTPQDNARFEYNIRSTGMCKLFCLLSAGKTAVDTNLRRYRWNGSGYEGTRGADGAGLAP